MLVTSVEMTDWQMLVERFKDGDNFPKFRNTNAPPSGPRRMTTTVQYLGASRGQFAYEDHETPWSIVAPNLDLTITNFPDYHGEATFKAGLISIQNYVPMWVNFKGRFAINGAKVHLDRAEIDTDGARTVAVGGVDFDHWPEQTYQVRSRVQFPRMRELFFAKETGSSAATATSPACSTCSRAATISPGTSRARSRRSTSTAFRRCLDRCTGRAASSR